MIHLCPWRIHACDWLLLEQMSKRLPCSSRTDKGWPYHRFPQTPTAQNTVSVLRTSFFDKTVDLSAAHDPQGSLGLLDLGRQDIEKSVASARLWRWNAASSVREQRPKPSAMGCGLEARCEISQLGSVKKSLRKRFEGQVWQRHGRTLINIVVTYSFPYQGKARRRQSTPYTPFAAVKTVATEVVRCKRLRKNLAVWRNKRPKLRPHLM